MVLYDSLTRSKARLLAQMSTGECKLKSYLHAIGAEDSELRECGQKEKVKHVLLDCRNWRDEREELKEAVRDNKSLG